MFLKKKEPYSPDETAEQTFTAYIIKGNRQVVKREVVASKRFRVDDETYLVYPEMIFLKNIDGELKSVSYYREGNPKPYDFIDDNTGVKPEELDRIYSEDFFNIIVDLQPKQKSVYLLLLAIINLMLCITFDIGVGLNAIF